jgi:hypothetical protein
MEHLVFVVHLSGVVSPLPRHVQRGSSIDYLNASMSQALPLLLDQEISENIGNILLSLLTSC